MTLKARGKNCNLVGSLLKKKPDASHRKISDETFNEAEIGELVERYRAFSRRIDR